MEKEGEKKGEEEEAVVKLPFAFGVFKVLYSPVKAFKQIVKKPSFNGVILILLLISLSVTCYSYVLYSKMFVEVFQPENADKWTEWNDASSQWKSNGVLDSSSNRLVGDSSIQCSVTNDNAILMNLTGIDPVNCSNAEGYKKLYFSANWTHSSGTPLSNAALRLFAPDKDNSFELNITGALSIANLQADSWADVALDVANDSWTPQGSPNWGNMTGVEFQLFWQPTETGNLTLVIDDLSFGGKYVIGTSLGAYSSVFIDVILIFFILWAIYSGLLFVGARMYADTRGFGKALFISVGYAFSTKIVYWLVGALIILTLPTVQVGRSRSLFDAWGSFPAYQIMGSLYFYIAFLVWSMTLCAVAIRCMFDFSWKKSANIALLTFILGFLITSLFGFTL